MRILRLNLLLFFSITSSLLFSQTERDSLTLEEKQGKFFFDKGVGWFTKDLDSSEYYMHLAAREYKKEEDWANYVISHCALYNILYNKGEHEKSYDYAKKAIEYADLYLPKKCIERNAALSNMAISLMERGHFKKVISTYEQIYSTEVALQDSIGQPITIGLLGWCYLNMGDTDEALKHYRQSLELWKEASPSLKSANQLQLKYFNEATSHNKIGKCFFKKEELDSAIIYHLQCLKILETPEIEDGNQKDKIQVETHFDLAEAFLKKENFVKTLYHINQANQLIEQTFFYNKGFANELLGRMFLKQKKTDKAILAFKKAKKLSIQEFNTYQKHPLISEKDIWIGKAYFQKKNFHQALLFFQKAINGLTEENKIFALEENPSPESFVAKKTALKAIAEKAKTEFLIFQTEKEQKYLRLANKTYATTTQLIQDIRQEYLATGSKQFLSQEVLPIFENAIQVSLNCFEITRDSNYLEEAFFYSESNKAIILLESLNANNAKGFAGIPNELLMEEESLRIEIAFYKRSKHQLSQQENFNVDDLKSFENKLFEEQKKHAQLIAQLEKDYPEYFNAKYDTKLATVKNIQTEMLHSNQVLIEYFFGEENIYIFSISKNHLSIEKIKKIEVINSILQLQSIINHPPNSITTTDDFQNFIHHSSFLFDQLLKKSISPATTDLIIIPDDILNYMPFEVFLIKKPSSSEVNYSFENLEYLLKSHAVGYSYSSTLLLNNKNTIRENHENLFLGVAPSFKSISISEKRLCNTDELYSLHCSENEVLQIQEILDGKTLIGQAATLENFRKNSIGSKVIHLATHACVDDKNPNFNKIHLTDDYISNNDLYNFDFNADLVVLSACNTGMGQLAKGEGVMSLSRGFFHAGSSSVMMSLWSVDDCATSDIMINFYRNLEEGKTKHESLRQSKISFISNGKKSVQHPYYWAAFVHIGNTSPLVLNNTFQWKYLIMLPFIFVIAFMIFIKKKKT